MPHSRPSTSSFATSTYMLMILPSSSCTRTQRQLGTFCQLDHAKHLFPSMAAEAEQDENCWELRPPCKKVYQPRTKCRHWWYTNPLENTPKYQVVTFNCTHFLKQHINISYHVGHIKSACYLFRCLAVKYWGSNFYVLHTSALTLCFSTAEYCARILSHSSYIRKVDSSPNDCLWLISSVIISTPTSPSYDMQYPVVILKR